jgi:acyl-CoA thioesterase
VTKFESDTALEPAGDGVWTGAISPHWSIVRGANGGHLAAILLRGMRLAVDDPSREPRSLTVHFARVPSNEPFEVRASVERTGRTMSNVSARMEQNGKLIALGIAAFSTPWDGPEFMDLSMPEVASPDRLDAVVDRPDFPFGQQFDYVQAIGHPDVRSEVAELGVWIRLREPQIADHVVVAQLMDAFAPAVFVKLGQGGGGAGVPTVEMTYHFRRSLPLEDARPEDWYLGVFRSTSAKDGFMEEDGWLWTQRGTLVAQSRQLALLAGPGQREGPR